MRVHLTDLGLRKLTQPASGQVTYWDAATPGFGVRLSAKCKSYVVMYGEKRKLKTLGRYPYLALADARKQAKRFLSHYVDNVNEPEEHDYAEVLAEYLVDCEQRLRASTLYNYRFFLRKIPFHGPIGRLGPNEVMKAIVRYTGNASSQNHAFITFKVFFNWAIRRQYLDRNPLLALRRPHHSVSRDRVLSEAEVTTLLTYTLSNRSRFNDIVSLLLLTGQRKGEIAGLRWSECLGDQLRLPPERTKNKRLQVVPIGKRAQVLLESIEGGATYVFGTPEVDRPFNGWGRAQRDIIAATGLAHFTLHDLRRTFATLHAKIGTPVHVTERLLNHVSGTISGVAAVYNRHSYGEEMRVAIERYDALLNETLK
jgi:integrase